MLLIVSKDADFSGVLAEQARSRLGIDCLMVPAFEGQAGEAKLIVTTHPIKEKLPVPVIVATPPVRLAALLAEMETALKGAADDVLVFGTWRFSLRRKELAHTTSGLSANLTDKEAQLLVSLIKAGKGGIGREALMKDVWGVAGDTDTHTLETHIYRLREKFRELGGDDVITANGGNYALKA